MVINGHDSETGEDWSYLQFKALMYTGYGSGDTAPKYGLTYMNKWEQHLVMTKHGKITIEIVDLPIKK